MSNNPVTEENQNQNIDELFKLAKENNKMLHGIKHAMVVGQVLAWVKFFLIVIPLVIAYFYLKPYYKDTVKFYSDLLGSPNNLKNNLLQQIQELK